MSTLCIDFVGAFLYHGAMSKTTKGTQQHTASLNMRLKPEQLELFRQAADHAGLSLSGWVRERLLRAAREEMGEADGA
jgi:uncharacterized protein (DUF1778 family)